MGFETSTIFKQEQALGVKESEQEKLTRIEKSLGTEYSEEERASFDTWLAGVPENSAENPLSIVEAEEVLGFLPSVGNYRGDKINLYFGKDTFDYIDLQSILEKFSQTNPNFEISVIRNNGKLISVGVGDKLRNRSTTFDGEYFGHYHQTQFALENSEVLPDSFVRGLLPSAGDVKGFFKHAEAVKEGTRIFSKNGYVLVKPIEGLEVRATDLENFCASYFDLFAGENKLEFKTDEEVADYFRQKLGFEVEFHYQ